MIELIIAAVARQTGVQADSLSPDTILGTEGLGLDSLGVLELVLSLEESTGFTLRTETLTGETLRTIGHLAVYLSSLSDD